MVTATPQSFILVLKQNPTQVMVVGAFTMYEVSEHAGAHHIEDCGFGIVVTTVFHDQAVTSRRFGSIYKLPTVFECVGGWDFGTGVLSRCECGEHLRNMPLPGRGDVNEVEVIAHDESLEVSLAVRVDAWSFLSGFLDHLRRAGALVFHDVADGVYDDVFD